MDSWGNFPPRGRDTRTSGVALRGGERGGAGPRGMGWKGIGGRIVVRSEVWRSSVILRSHLLVLVASSDVLLDIDDVALVRGEVWRLYVMLRAHFLRLFRGKKKKRGQPSRSLTAPGRGECYASSLRGRASRMLNSGIRA